MAGRSGEGIREKKSTIEEERQDAFVSVSLSPRRLYVTYPDPFLQLKMICVPLLGLTRVPPTTSTTSLTLEHLTQLRSTLTGIPSTVFTPALANYVFFPISTLLQPGVERGEAVLEGVMSTLEILVSKWRGSSGGEMEIRTLHELWIMIILLLGGPIDPAQSGSNSKGKGKEKEAEGEKSDEIKLAILKVLWTLMHDTKVLAEENAEGKAEEEDDFLGENIDWTTNDDLGPPSPPPSPPPLLKPDRILSPPIPILFHTLTTLLKLASSSTSLVELQLVSLRSLKTLLEVHLVPHAIALPTSEQDDTSMGPSPLLATALPGTASTLSRIALSLSPSSSILSIQARRQPTQVIIEALAVLALLLRSSIGDDVTSHLRQELMEKYKIKEEVASLQELVEGYDDTIGLEEISSENVQSQDEAPSLPAPDPSNPSSSSSAPGPTVPTSSWLLHTLSQIGTLLRTLSTLTSHESPLVRVGLSALFIPLLQGCFETLGENSRFILEGLLSLGGDEWEQVASPCRTFLVEFLRKESEDDGISTRREWMNEIVKSKLTGLAHSIRRGEEKKVNYGATIIITALELSNSSSFGVNSASGMLLMDGIERWSWNLLSALEFERIRGVGEEERGGGMKLAWITGGSPTGVEGEGIAQEEEWPILGLKNLKEESTRKTLENLWSTLGAYSMIQSREEIVIESFIGIALGARGNEATACAALWVLDGLLRGFGSGDDEKRKVKAKGRKLVKNVVRRLIGLLEKFEEGVGVEIGPEASDASKELSTAPELLVGSTTSEIDLAISTPIVHEKGISLTPSLDSLKPTTTSSSSAANIASHQALLTCLIFRIFSTSAGILSSSFQPLFLQVLYHLLSKTSPTSPPVLRQHAQIALARIAYHTSHASIENLIYSNVDYVINSVSSRLSMSRLDPKAPLVLVEMIRLVGAPIVPMVQDLVGDVFEALDDYHGYDEVTVGLWAVLDAIMRVMAGGCDLEKKGKAMGEGSEGPNGERDWQKFEAWFIKRKESKAEEEEEEVEFETNPRKPFSESSILPGSNEEEPEGGFPSKEKESLPPTRPQEVAAQILSKALFFLSHSSPFLRSRVLSLIASAIPLLAIRMDPLDPTSSRQSDLLPVIHRSWPYIINRLKDTEAYVVLEASSLIESLATFVGDFLSRRILDDVWPEFKVLLKKMDKLEKDATLRRGNSDGWGGGGIYTTSHRIRSSILRTMISVIEQVPLKENNIWEMSLLFRPFLNSQRSSKELQSLARKLYAVLGRLNEDAVWLVLRGSSREGGLAGMEWLRREGEFCEDNIELILGNF